MPLPSLIPRWIPRLAGNTVQREFAYRANKLVALCSRLLILSVYMQVWRALFDNANAANAPNTGISNYNFNSMAFYIVIANLFRVPFSLMHINLTASQIRSGELTTQLCRPVSYALWSMVWLMAQRAYHFFMTCIAAAVILALLGVKGQLALSPIAVLLLVSNVMLLSLFGLFLSNIAFWTIDIWPLTALCSALASLIGGSAYPLDLLPSAVYNIIILTPFPYFSYVNVKAFQGLLAQSEMASFMILSLLQVALYGLLYKITWHYGLKRYEGVGQ